MRWQEFAPPSSTLVAFFVVQSQIVSCTKICDKKDSLRIDRMSEDEKIHKVFLESRGNLNQEDAMEKAKPMKPVALVMRL